MKKYFKDIKKPKWYIIVCAIFLYIFQCMAIINICPQFGGEYYLIIPLQLITGYLNVLVFLMAQKDVAHRLFLATIAISVVCGVAASFLIFQDIYTSVSGFEGILDGAVMQITLSMVFYVLINLSKCIILDRHTKHSEEC